MTTASSNGQRPEIDVLILGSGLAGSVLASVLARGGANVLILDAGSHPRFAIGESTIPYTSMLMRLISERYDVPEIKYLTTFEALQEKVTPTCGVKRNFGFLYHRAGERQNPIECHEFPIPKITHTENHFFRQDIDAWLLSVALRYGARVKQRTRVADFDFADDAVTAITEDGTHYRARYLIDASGFRSPLAEKLDLREKPSRLRHHSRALFTHMVDVAPYEETVLPKGVHGNPTKWSHGTLHHLFEGGWIWVIPFNNHARATNSLISVGMNVDPRVHPRREDVTPEQEFFDFIDAFPDVRKQFSKARAVREWVSTPRLQYSSHTTVGHRWCLTSHAAGFIDALFSRGLSNSLEIINALAWRLLEALRDDDFSVERFAYVQHLEQGLLDFNDDLVANAYTSFSHYDLWDAWFRVWSLGQILATFEINRGYAKYIDARDPAELARLERLAPEGSIPDYQPARELLARVSREVRAVADGSEDAGETARRVMGLLQAADFVPPAFGLTDPDNRWFHATTPNVMRALRWSRTKAPREIGDLVYEGLTLFMRKRLSPSEFDVTAELKHLVAEWPIGKPLRVPVPK